jgi:hypothetical protein
MEGEDCEGVIQDLITDKLDMTDNVEFDRVHRLSSKTDSPIIARCCFYKQKIKILRAKKNLKGSNVFVGEDFSFRVRDIRRKLSPHLKKARNEGKQVRMVYDHLFIEGCKFVLDEHDSFNKIR